MAQPPPPPFDLPPPPPMTVPETRAYLRRKHKWSTSPATLYNWVSTGRGGILLEYVRVGGRIRFERKAIDDFIASYN